MYSIYKGDKFRCLKFKSIISGELKSIITILLILAMLMQTMWGKLMIIPLNSLVFYSNHFLSLDIVSTYVKYEEGFIVYEGNIISKPFSEWTATHKKHMTVNF